MAQKKNCRFIILLVCFKYFSWSVLLFQNFSDVTQSVFVGYKCILHMWVVVGNSFVVIRFLS